MEKQKKFIDSIDRVCGNDAQEKNLDLLHGSVRRYKTLRSSTNCGCGHLMTQFVGSISMAKWGTLLIVVPAPGAAVAPLQAVWTSG